MATADYYRLLTKAYEAGVSPSEYMRECFRNGYVQERLSKNSPIMFVSSVAWRTTSTSLRIRQMPVAFQKPVGIVKLR